ncbi:MAG: PQQ-dependent sugar dehydrogenase [Hydrogenophilaceae bacterium]|nr:PQQ-dependent sugar dehydrogenase [Hydrogenophilaceae bacterium]
MRQGLAALAALALAACSGGGGGGGGGNSAPSFTSANAASVPENSAGAVYTATATDADGDTITFSISGGADAGRFSINATSGALSFASPPDFEAPSDANGDNIYLVTIAASDGQASVALNVAITVTNVSGAIAWRRRAQGLSQPLFVADRGDGSGRMFVVERGGLVRVFTPATSAVEATPILNVSTEIATDGERGLLGFAAAPDFATSGRYYVFLVTPSGVIQVRRYQVGSSAGDVVFALQHPRTNHLGGWIGFDANQLLHIAIGDGGGSGDPDGNGQNPNTLFGKILRIDPRTDAFPGDPDRDYAIPPSNPFATSGGAPEAWVYGLRNPFRASFDRANGNLYIGDVGQGAIEEIDLVRPGDGGRNYGWNILEGTQIFAGGATAGLTPPIAEYPHTSTTGAPAGRSVTGGVVYRGPIASLRGEYIFGDFITQRVFSFPVSAVAQGTTIANTQFTERTQSWAPSGATLNQISSFGEDAIGNLYVTDFDGEVFRLEEIE